jgi:EF-P beta-lysylation protein EpmB
MRPAAPQKPRSEAIPLFQDTELSDRGEPVRTVGRLSRPVRWQEELRGAFRSTLLSSLDGSATEEEASVKLAVDRFPLVLPESVLSIISDGDPSDPIARQFLPRAEENEGSSGFLLDPVGDHAARSAPGLIQKYDGRVLLIVSGTCAVHCRYCFRRHYPYAADPKDLASFEPAMEQIESDASIREVILSGGDPLSRTDEWLCRLVERLARIGQLETLRIHTRFPVVIPSRVTEGLLGALTGSRLNPVMVLHVNHARELSNEAREGIRQLRDSGILLLNQSVLLAGVNDSVEVLEELSRELFRERVMPYYLHQLDRVVGATHFEVPVERGRALIESLRRRLPGYLVPRYVREEAGEASKTTLG